LAAMKTNESNEWGKVQNNRVAWQHHNLRILTVYFNRRLVCDLSF
jgi:hypothetical protein